MNRLMMALPARRQDGFTLIELMVALILGLVVTGALIQLFLASKLTYTVTDGLVRAQENARHTLMVVNRELRMAGSQPICSGADIELSNLVAPGNFGEVGQILNAGGFFAFDYSGTETDEFDFPLNGGGNANADQWGNFQGTGLPAALRGRALPGTDVLGIATMQALGDDITGCSNNNANQTSLNVCDRDGNQTGHPIGFGEIVTVVDCTARVGDIFANNTPGQAGNQPLNRSQGLNTSGVGNINARWSTEYRENTEIYRAEVTYYFIGASLGSTAANFRPALFRVRNCNNGNNCNFEELAEGVENMQIFFRRQGDDTLYTPRNFPRPWNEVATVEMDLVLVSPEQVDNRALDQSLELGNGLIVNMTDRRLRLVYSNTIGIRNQMVVR
jgi:type IV pilus assembly protein PilW